MYCCPMEPHCSTHSEYLYIKAYILDTTTYIIELGRKVLQIGGGGIKFEEIESKTQTLIF